MTLIQSLPHEQELSAELPDHAKQLPFDSNENQSCHRSSEKDSKTEKFVIEHESDEIARINGLQRGDRDCYEWLVRVHTGKLLGIARRYLNEQEAQDAVQESFIKAFEHIGAFRAASCLATWLHRIVINNCLSKLRCAHVRLEISLESQSEPCTPDGESENMLTSWPEQFASDVETKRIVRSCLANMSEAYRTVILLRDIEGYSGQEAAQLLGISANLVKVRLHRARRNLRDQLTKNFVQTSDANGFPHSM